MCCVVRFKKGETFSLCTAGHVLESARAMLYALKNGKLFLFALQVMCWSQHVLCCTL